MSTYKPEESSRLVVGYTLFKEEFQPKLDSIYYPSCGFDASATKAFPESRIMYVDIDKNIVRALKKHGLDARCANAEELDLEAPVDAVILQNQSIQVDKPVSNLRKGGFVLCNDYHSAATELRKNDNFSLVAMVRADTSSRTLTVERENLDDYWKYVETDEEFKLAPFSWGGAIDYDQAREIVRAVRGVETDILANYVEIRNEALAELLTEQATIKEETGTDLDLGDIPLIKADDGDYILPSLPRKKGTVDDLFVYQKMA